MFTLLFACAAPSESTGSPADSSDSGAPSVCGTTPEGMAVTLPDDDAAHTDEDVEWWYWTGHLQDEAGHWYGFEEVFFLLDYGGELAEMVHRAVTDVDGQAFHYDVDYGLAQSDLPTQGYALTMSGQTATGGDGHDTLHADADGFSFDLAAESTKSPVYQHGDGYTDYDNGGYTYYYSRERLAVDGTLTLADGDHAVTGDGWFDHQWGALFSVSMVGWDWYALQLDDDSEIMLFLLHDGEGTTMVGGSWTDAGCNVTEIDPADVTITPRGEWTSDVTGCTYPQGWDLRIGDRSFGITPVLADQELDGGYMAYWEGAATIDGSSGRAYVELNGYCGS